MTNYEFIPLENATVYYFVLLDIDPEYTVSSVFINRLTDDEATAVPVAGNVVQLEKLQGLVFKWHSTFPLDALQRPSPRRVYPREKTALFVLRLS